MKQKEKRKRDVLKPKMMLCYENLADT